MFRFHLSTARVCYKNKKNVLLSKRQNKFLYIIRYFRVTYVVTGSMEVTYVQLLAVWTVTYVHLLAVWTVTYVQLLAVWTITYVHLEAVWTVTYVQLPALWTVTYIQLLAA